MLQSLNRARSAVLGTLLGLVWLGCMSALTGGVEPVVARANPSDPVQAAVAKVLASSDALFAPVLGPSLSEAEQAELVDGVTSFRYSAQGQSSMDLLRMAESMASSARHVEVSIPGADPIYYEQPVMVGNVNALARAIEFRFDVPFEERVQKTNDLVARLAPLFAGAKNWNRLDMTDPSVNPMIGGTNFSTYLSMSMDASSEFLMVSAEYYHDRVNHEAMKGVRLRIHHQSTRVD